MGLRDIVHTLPPGFRFYPSDEELVYHYLYKKICKKDAVKGDTLVEINLHTCEPWQLPDVAKLNSNEWYFFSFRNRKYSTGYRAIRATASGYWKATGKDRKVRNVMTRGITGMRKTLVFYKNRAPNGIKTEWIMHEYRVENLNLPPKEDWVLCKVFNKSRSSSPENAHKIAQNDEDTNNLCDPITVSIPLNLSALSPSDNGHDSGHDQHHQPGLNTSASLSKIDLVENKPSCDYDDRNKLPELKSCEDDFGFLFDIVGFR